MLNNGFPQRFVLAGIGTDVGKTLVSAILCAGLKSQYWKPIQSGLEGGTDTENVQALSGLPAQYFLKEAFRLQLPASPHLAARGEDVVIHAKDLNLPETDQQLLIELAGGLSVPLNDDGLLMLDIVEQWRLPVVLVVNTYLGSINHSLLSIEALRNRGIPIFGLIFNEGDQPASEEAIHKFGNVKVLASLPYFENVSEMKMDEIFKQYFVTA